MDNKTENNYGLPVPPAEAHYTVYKLTDPDGKVYIGCTGKPVEQRWQNGKNYNSATLIHKAISEIGWENFEKKILCENLTKAGAEKLEKWFIAYYDSSDPAKGYNRALGGLGKGVRMSEATKQRSKESRQKLLAEHPELTARIRNSIISLYERDPSYRRKLSEIAKELWQDPAYREKTIQGALKRNANPEMSHKLRIGSRRDYAAHPEKREEISRRMKEYLSKPENRIFIDSDSRAKPVICVETGEVFPSQHAAEIATGFYSIHKACSGMYKTSGGYHWQYA